MILSHVSRPTSHVLRKSYGLKSPRGSILIAVLWSLFFLSTLAVAIHAYISPQLGLAGRLQDRAKLSYVLKAGVKQAAGILGEDETESFDALNDLWSNNEEIFKEIEVGAEGRFSVKYLLPDGDEQQESRYGLVDEERKININKAPPAVVKHFFESVAETSSQQADDIAHSIADWIDEDDEPQSNGAESGYYATLKPPYPCKNKPFEILEELLFIKGMTPEIFDKVKDRITLFGEGAVNINTADSLVLNSLELSQELIEKIMQFRGGPDGEEATEDDNVFESADTIVPALMSAQGLSQAEVDQLNGMVSTKLLDVRSDHFMGHVLGELTDRDVSTEAIFVVYRDTRIEYWREF